MHTRAMKQISYSRTDGISIMPATEQFISNVNEELARNPGYVGKQKIFEFFLFLFLNSAFEISLFKNNLIIPEIPLL